MLQGNQQRVLPARQLGHNIGKLRRHLSHGIVVLPKRDIAHHLPMLPRRRHISQMQFARPLQIMQQRRQPGFIQTSLSSQSLVVGTTGFAAGLHCRNIAFDGVFQ